MEDFVGQDNREGSLAWGWHRLKFKQSKEGRISSEGLVQNFTLNAERFMLRKGEVDRKVWSFTRTLPPYTLYEFQRLQEHPISCLFSERVGCRACQGKWSGLC